MKKKKCKWWTDKIDYQGCIHFSKKNCDGKTNKDCEIIPRKKPMLKRIKGYAEITGHLISVLNWKTEVKTIPCTILIDRKHLEGK